MAKTFQRPFGEMIRKFTKYAFFVRNEAVVLMGEGPDGEPRALQSDASGNLVTSPSSAGSGVYSQIGTSTIVAANSSTLTDTGLSVNLGVGTWEISYVIICNSSGFAAAGSKIQNVFSGTGAGAGFLFRFSQAASATNGYETWLGAPEDVTVLSLFNNGTSSLRIDGHSIFTVTGAGTFKSQIAQNTAVAAQTVSIGMGSMIIARKLGS